MADHVGRVRGRGIEDAQSPLDPDLAVLGAVNPGRHLVDVDVHLGAQVDVRARLDGDQPGRGQVDVLPLLDLDGVDVHVLVHGDLHAVLVRERSPAREGPEGDRAGRDGRDLVQMLGVVRVFGVVARDQDGHAGGEAVLNPAPLGTSEGACRGVDVHRGLGCHAPGVQHHRGGGHAAAGFRRERNTLEGHHAPVHRGDFVELSVVRGVGRVPVHSDVESLLEPV